MTTPFPDPQFVNANGVRLAIYEADGDPERKRAPVVLVHGWPEIAYSWRGQLQALAKAGWRAIALDLKGFGRSDAPRETALYDMEHVTNDLASLLDALKIEKAVFCGHDWGGAIVWGMGQWQANRVAGVISLCTPLHPRAPAPPIEIIRKRFGERHYFVQFQQPGVPEKLFESDIEKFFRMIFRRPVPRKIWPRLIPGVFDLTGRFRAKEAVDAADLVVSSDDIAVYVEAYKHSGFHGGINLYRNIDRNWALMEGRDETVRAPALWIGADLDLFLPPETAEGMERIVPDLEKHILEDCGHWIMVEKARQTNALVTDWLARRISS